MPKSPKNKSKNDPDEPVTQFFNFPEAWVKDYDPQIHGFRPPSHFQQPQPIGNPPQQMPPGQVQQPNNGQIPPQNYPPMPQGYNLQTTPQTQSNWNPNGVYGGLAESKKKSFPWWGWLLIVVLVLLILLIVGSTMKIYPVF